MARVIESIGMMALLVRRGTPPVPALVAAMPIQTRSASSNAQKSKQAVTIKRLRKENKDIFGDLLETKYEKVKREKKTKKNAAKGLHLLKDGESGQEALSSESMPENSQALPKIETINSKSEDRKLGTKNESGWAVKSFPQRSKVIRRSNPEITVHSFEELKLPSGQYKVVPQDSLTRQLPSHRMSINEIHALPTMQQVCDSFQESHDILPSFSMKIVRKGSPGTGSVIKAAGPFIAGHRTPEPLAVDQVTHDNNDNNGQEGVEYHEGVSVSAEESQRNYAANDEVEVDKSSSLFLSAHPPIDAFPYDNPEKKMGNNKNEIETQDDIISLPFPRTVRNSQDLQLEQQPRVPSVSKILNATMSPKQVEILKKWEEKMIAKLGEMGFLRYKEDLFANGKKFHSNIQSVLSGTPQDELTIEDSISGHWNSLQSIFPKIEKVQVLESHVFHPQLNYCGIVDCVAKFGDKLVVIDWKTSEKPKPSIALTYDTPLQIAAYVGALNYDPNYSLKIHAGLVVIAYKDGKDCQTYFLNSSQIDSYWKRWLERLKLFQSQTQSSNQ